MKIVPLSLSGKCAGRYVAIVDDEDFDFISQWRWTALVGEKLGRPYVRAYRQIRRAGAKRQFYMHRVIWERTHGPILDGKQIDHREHGLFGGLDNRRVNLRLADQVQQNGNRRNATNKSSRFRGVSWDKDRQKWNAKITVHYKTVNLGRFASEIEAARAYDKLAREHFGQFARLNLEDGALCFAS